jgi:transcription antitermination factor NusG
MERGQGPDPTFASDPKIRAELFESSHWYACRTRARAEKRVDSLMASSGIQTYLPLILRERQWTDRKKRVAFPLLPGYVFAKFPLTEIARVLKTPGVASVAQPNGYPSPIREEELDSVRRLVAGVAETGLPPVAAEVPQEGEDVEIVAGPFRGVRGLLIEVRGRSRVIVALSAIPWAVSVEVGRSMIRSAAVPHRRIS